MKSMISHRAILFALLYGWLLVSTASAVDPIPYVFSPGSPARSAEFNANFQHLIDAINALQAQLNANRVPPGAVVASAAAAPPLGWLEANGQAVSRTVYADLFAVIGITYGTGDGIMTFNVPDLRGAVLVGLDEAVRSLGSFHTNAQENHTHGANLAGGTDIQGDHSHLAGIFFTSINGNHNHGVYVGGLTGTPVDNGPGLGPEGDVALMYLIKY